MKEKNERKGGKEKNKEHQGNSGRQLLSKELDSGD